MPQTLLSFKHFGNMTYFVLSHKINDTYFRRHKAESLIFSYNLNNTANIRPVREIIKQERIIYHCQSFHFMWNSLSKTILHQLEFMCATLYANQKRSALRKRYQAQDTLDISAAQYCHQFLMQAIGAKENLEFSEPHANTFYA